MPRKTTNTSSGMDWAELKRALQNALKSDEATNQEEPDVSAFTHQKAIEAMAALPALCATRAEITKAAREAELQWKSHLCEIGVVIALELLRQAGKDDVVVTYPDTGTLYHATRFQSKTVKLFMNLQRSSNGIPELASSIQDGFATWEYTNERWFADFQTDLERGFLETVFADESQAAVEGTVADMSQGEKSQGEIDNA